MPRLLIVEDYPAQREILRLVFSDDYEVRTANDGFEAIEILEDWQPNLVITDYSMPGMTGLELVRKIENGKWRYPIILCSAHLTAEIEKAARALGVQACIAKPFDLEELKELVRRISATEDEKTWNY